MNKLLLLLPAAAALLLSGCADDPYYGRVANDGPAYRGRDYGPDYGAGYGPDYGPGDYGVDDYGPGGDIDFYYVGGRPYSRYYGPLVFRDNRYYFSRGGSYTTYDVDFGRHHSFRNGGYAAARGGHTGGAHYGDGKPIYRGQGGVAAGRDARAYYGNNRLQNGRGPGGYQQHPGAVQQRPPGGVPQKGHDKKKDDDRH